MSNTHATEKTAEHGQSLEVVQQCPGQRLVQAMLDPEHHDRTRQAQVRVLGTGDKAIVATDSGDSAHFVAPRPARPPAQVSTLWPLPCCDGPMPEPIRLARYVAEVARCSRAEAEQYIEGSWVRVDGDVVEDPQW